MLFARSVNLHHRKRLSTPGKHGDTTPYTQKKTVIVLPVNLIVHMHTFAGQSHACGHISLSVDVGHHHFQVVVQGDKVEAHCYEQEAFGKVYHHYGKHAQRVCSVENLVQWRFGGSEKVIPGTFSRKPALRGCGHVYHIDRARLECVHVVKRGCVRFGCSQATPVLLELYERRHHDVHQIAEHGEPFEHSEIPVDFPLDHIEVVVSIDPAFWRVTKLLEMAGHDSIWRCDSR